MLAVYWHNFLGRRPEYRAGGIYMKKEIIMAIRCGDRRENADALQKVLTASGCSIKMRLGLHEAGDACSNEGLILLYVVDRSDEIKALETALEKIDGVRVKAMEI
jgi:hypothetical protein